ncbi:MAG: sel1 repeat family protein, partial [Synergistaceae bacterium]|nr:sel1 repeat family protein [Synergistaceae bacterium]
MEIKETLFEILINGVKNFGAEIVAGILLFVFGVLFSKWRSWVKEEETTDPKKQFELGNKNYEKKYYGKAVKWYIKAAEQENIDAQLKLGFMYENGDGVEQDDKEAAKWYRRAAEREDTQAQLKLGDMYYSGKGVKKDYEEAAHWYRKAADQGNVDAQCNLGFMYRKGEGVRQNYEEA